MSIGQYRVYCRLFAFPEEMRKHNGNATSLGGTVESIESPDISIPFRDLHLLIRLNVRLMKRDCPSLLTVRNWIAKRLYPRILDRKIKNDGRRMTLTKSNGFLIYHWNPEEICYTVFTEQNLHRLHRSFKHPYVNEISNLLQRTNPQEFNAETRCALEEISLEFSTCSRYSWKPRQFCLTVCRWSPLKSYRLCRVFVYTQTCSTRLCHEVDALQFGRDYTLFEGEWHGKHSYGVE